MYLFTNTFDKVFSYDPVYMCVIVILCNINFFIVDNKTLKKSIYVHLLLCLFVKS